MAVAYNAGRPRVPLRIIITLLYLKHALNESDEGVVARWADTPRWQFFSGCAYYEDRQPCDATTLVKLHQLLDEEGFAELLAQTINMAVELKLIKPQELTRKAGCCAHARQFKRRRRAIKRRRTIVGRLQCEVDHKAPPTESASSTPGMRRRWTASARARPKTFYGFVVKVGIASTPKDNLIMSARAFHGNPYDGHTLNRQLEQVTTLMRDSAVKLATAFVDLSYRGVDAQNPDVHIVHRGKSKRISAQERKQRKQLQAIEPIIGHLKVNHRMGRCQLKGEIDHRLHAALCAAEYNIRWLLRMIARKGITFMRRLYLRLWTVADVSHWDLALLRL